MSKNEVTEFVNAANEKIKKIGTTKKASAATVQEKLKDAQSKLSAATAKMDAAMEDCDTERYKAAAAARDDAQIVVNMYSLQLRKLLESTDIASNNESKVFFANAQSLKSQLANKAFTEIISLLTQVETISHSFEDDMKTIDAVAADWNDHVKTLEEATPYHDGHYIPFDDKGLYNISSSILSIGEYRMAHGHNESSFSGNGPHWTV